LAAARGGGGALRHATGTHGQRAERAFGVQCAAGAAQQRRSVQARTRLRARSAAAGGAAARRAAAGARQRAWRAAGAAAAAGRASRAAARVGAHARAGVTSVAMTG
jgi:hypothetical protein